MVGTFFDTGIKTNINIKKLIIKILPFILYLIYILYRAIFQSLYNSEGIMSHFSTRCYCLSMPLPMIYYCICLLVSMLSKSYAMRALYSSRSQHLSTRSSAASISATFSMSISEKYAQLPLKIAVAGCGVGGVMAAYALQKKGFEVTVFEKAAKFSRFGGPIQLASNALSCVNSLSPELFEQIMSRFDLSRETCSK